MMESSHYTPHLPTEIWERIFKMLSKHPRTIISVSNVCCSWRHIVTSICKKFCINNIDETLIEELSDITVTPYIRENKDEREENGTLETRDWVKIFWFYIETEVSSTEASLQPFPNIKKACSAAFEYPYLVISSVKMKDGKGHPQITIFNAEHFPFLQNLEREADLVPFLNIAYEPLTLKVAGGPHQISFLHLPSPVILLASDMKNLQAVILERLKDPNHSRKMNAVVYTNPPLSSNSKISCEGKWLLTNAKRNPELILLFEASVMPRKEELQLELMFKIKTITAPFSFHIYKKMIYTMESSGHVRVYKLTFCSSECEIAESCFFVSQSELQKDLRYPNPTTFVKNYIFCSTSVSADLLGYWHMDRGKGFWIIGDLFQIKKNGTNDPRLDDSDVFLHKVYIGKETGFAVSQIHYQRGILFFGTHQGHVIGYKFNGKNREVNKLTSKEEGNASTSNFDFLAQKPCFLIHNVSDHSIARLSALFTPFAMVLVVIDSDRNCSLVTLPSKYIP